MNIALAGIVILAGGESSRMGSPKALLTLPTGERLIDFHIRHAKSLNVPVMVADNGKNFCQNSNVIKINDYLPNSLTGKGKGEGALSAIMRAFQLLTFLPYEHEAYILVVSCDCLIGANKIFEKLFYQMTDSDEVIYFKGKKDYPLLGLYRLDLLPQLKNFLDNGNRSVMQFLRDKKVKTVDLPSEWVALANFNTKNEFELALAQLDKENS